MGVGLGVDVGVPIGVEDAVAVAVGVALGVTVACCRRCSRGCCRRSWCYCCRGRWSWYDGAVSSAGIHLLAAVISAPDNHFTAGPDCRVPGPGLGRIGRAAATQLSVLGLYLPPVFK